MIAHEGLTQYTLRMPLIKLKQIHDSC